MKICFIGLGSIGSRHIINLVDCLEKKDIDYEIHALRSSHRPLKPEIKQYITREINSYDELPNDYDIIFVTNPTMNHYDTLKKIINNTKNIFIEKPLYMDTSVSPESLNPKPDSVYYVAAPMRYNGVIKVIEEFISKNKVFSARAICSSYLPEWRKGIDYRQNYSAHKNEGGGVTLDLIHEWDYLKKFFGNPKKICCINGTYSDLEIDSDDLSVYLAEYDDKVIEVHLDYFGRRAKRTLELFTERGTLIADFIGQSVIFDDGKTINELSVQKVDDIYKSEMDYFMCLCTGEIKYNQNDMNNAFETLKLITGDLS